MFTLPRRPIPLPPTPADPTAPLAIVLRDYRSGPTWRTAVDQDSLRRAQPFTPPTPARPHYTMQWPTARPHRLNRGCRSTPADYTTTPAHAAVANSDHHHVDVDHRDTRRPNREQRS